MEVISKNPNRINPQVHSLTHTYLKRLAFSGEQHSQLRLLNEYKNKHSFYLKHFPEILSKLKGLALLEANTYPADRSRQEIEGYQEARNSIYQAASHLPFSIKVILHIHQQLFLSTSGGQWKSHDHNITQLQSDGTKRTIFVPLAAYEIPKAMKSLVTHYAKCVYTWNQEPLLIIPLTIFDFFCIHPFKDGNGRTARLLIQLLLTHFNYQIGRYICLERIMEDSRYSYYEALDASCLGWHEGKHDIKPWLAYFWAILVQAYGEVERRIEVYFGTHENAPCKTPANF